MPPATPSDTLIGRRVALTAKAVRGYTESRLAGAGSSLSTVIVLRIVGQEPGLSQRELAQRMDLQGPTVLRHLDRMEADGLITRTRDQHDRRIQRVQLTAAGRTARTRLERVAIASHSTLTDVFTDDEVATLEALLDRLADHARTLLASES